MFKSSIPSGTCCENQLALPFDLVSRCDLQTPVIKLKKVGTPLLAMGKRHNIPRAWEKEPSKRLAQISMHGYVALDNKDKLK